MSSRRNIFSMLVTPPKGASLQEYSPVELDNQMGDPHGIEKVHRTFCSCCNSWLVCASGAAFLSLGLVLVLTDEDQDARIVGAVCTALGGLSILGSLKVAWHQRSICSEPTGGY